MKIRKFSQLHEGARINTSVLELHGTHDINNVIESIYNILSSDAKLEMFHVKNSFLAPPVFEEIKRIGLNLENMRNDGVISIKGNGDEWIPIW